MGYDVLDFQSIPLGGMFFGRDLHEAQVVQNTAICRGGYKSLDLRFVVEGGVWRNVEGAGR